MALLLALFASRAEALTFTDVTDSAGVAYVHGYRESFIDFQEWAVGGVAAGDYDNDGFVDLYAVRGDSGPNLLFRNRGDGSFEEVGAAAGVALDGRFDASASFADVDGDGWLDLLVVGLLCPPRVPHCPPGTLGLRPGPALFHNRGDGTFADATAESGIALTRDSNSAAFGDYDRDGDLDLFLTHWGENRPAGSTEQLWRNQGNGRFSDVSVESGLAAAYVNPATPSGEIGDLSFTANFADIDSDGWPDLLVAGDFRTSKVFRNDRAGHFVEITSPVISDENGMGAAVADFDHDGDLDWFVSSIWDPNGVAEGAWYVSGNRLYRNLGDGRFEDATDAAGVRRGYWGWGSTFADVDNDGNLDIFHVNGWRLDDPAAAEFHQDPSRLFISRGDGTFAETSAPAGLVDSRNGRGVVAFDYDRDGDVDLFISNNQQGSRLYRNEGGGGNHLSVKLFGDAPNTEAVGARIHVGVDGGPTQMWEMRAGSNYVSQDPVEAHFGLGAAVEAEVRVVWPNGAERHVGRVAANRRLLLAQSGDDPTPPPTPVPPPATPTQTATPRPCAGDCDEDGAVSLAEIRALLDAALAGDASCRDDVVSVDRLVAAVGCGRI